MVSTCQVVPARNNEQVCILFISSYGASCLRHGQGAAAPQCEHDVAALGDDSRSCGGPRRRPIVCLKSITLKTAAAECRRRTCTGGRQTSVFASLSFLPTEGDQSLGHCRDATTILNRLPQPIYASPRQPLPPTACRSAFTRLCRRPCTWPMPTQPVCLSGLQGRRSRAVGRCGSRGVQSEGARPARHHPAADHWQHPQRLCGHRCISLP